MLSKAEVVEEGAACCTWWPLSSHTQHMEALQEGKRWPPGAGLDASVLSQDSSGVLDDTQLVGQDEQDSITPTTRRTFSFSFFFIIFDFFMFLKKKSCNFLGQRSLYLQQNLFILQEILSATFFGNVQFS